MFDEELANSLQEILLSIQPNPVMLWLSNGFIVLSVALFGALIALAIKFRKSKCYVLVMVLVLLSIPSLILSANAIDNHEAMRKVDELKSKTQAWKTDVFTPLFVSKVPVERVKVKNYDVFQDHAVATLETDKAIKLISDIKEIRESDDGTTYVETRWVDSGISELNFILGAPYFSDTVLYTQ